MSINLFLFVASMTITLFLVSNMAIANAVTTTTTTTIPLPESFVPKFDTPEQILQLQREVRGSIILCGIPNVEQFTDKCDLQMTSLAVICHSFLVTSNNKTLQKEFSMCDDPAINKYLREHNYPTPETEAGYNKLVEIANGLIKK